MRLDQLALATLLLVALAGSARADGLVIVVNFADDLPDQILNDNLADALSSEPGIQTSLRAAVMLANKVEGLDTIVVPPGVWKLKNKGQDEDACVTGDLDVTDDLIIEGTAPVQGIKNDGSIIDGKKLKDRMFDVAEGVTLTLQGLTVRNGRAAKEQAGGLATVRGTLVLEEVEVRTCKAPLGGGAIHVPAGAGSVSVHEALFYKNRTDGNGGALSIEGGQAQIENATFQKNRADKEGGGLEVRGAIASLTNVTFSANSAGQDGGAMRLHGNGVLTLVNVTSFANACKKTAGLSAIEVGGSNNALVRNSIFDDKGDRNGSGQIVSLGGNVDSGTTCNFAADGDDLSDIDPQLLKLGDNGGFTPTHALDPDSPAIDAGTDPGAPAEDQRGMPRVDIDGVGPDFVKCDVGAFEFAESSEP